jgi:hypothetical protein
MSTPFARAASQTLTSVFQQVRPRLAQIDCDAVARQSGFLIRKTRKIPVVALLLALIALAPQGRISLERIASVTGLAAGCNYAKQAFQKRLKPTIEDFLGRIAALLLVDLSAKVCAQGLFKPFKRVLVHDSTCHSLPEHLASFFPGSKNQRNKPSSILKIQLVVDILDSSLVDVSLAGYTRNDQSAARDLLALLRPGDLVLRDLGYFVSLVFEAIAAKGAFFLSRYKHGVKLFTLDGQELNLVEELRGRGQIDQEVFLSESKVRVRLVAQPVPQSVADERRRKAKASRERRSKPSREHLFLMGWNIFVTNVSAQQWPAKALFPIYRLRWRIEMIFKAWKSHLGLRQINAANEALVRLSVMSKLLFCMLVLHIADELESLAGGQAQVSLFRLARIMSQCCDLISAQIMGLSPEQWLQHQLQHHLFYERRKDRGNYSQVLAQMRSLG